MLIAELTRPWVSDSEWPHVRHIHGEYRADFSQNCPLVSRGSVSSEFLENIAARDEERTCECAEQKDSLGLDNGKERAASFP